MNFIQNLTAKEARRQQDTLNLIASENYPSPKVLELLGSVWQNKYAEGYPGKRYYAGNINTDELESYVQQKALEVFDSTGEYGVNVQVLSGSPANATVYLAMLEQGDIILSLSLPDGGHLSHLHATSAYAKFYNHATYSVVRTAGSVPMLDIASFESKLKEVKPKLVIIGFSAYPPKYEFATFIKLAHQYGAFVLADIAHIAGLVAAYLHDSPFKKGSEGADFVSMTTHKTLRGPRGAMLFAKQEHMEKINKTVFPGTSGGPHLHQIAAIGQSLLEVLGEDLYPNKVAFKDYAKNVVDTAKALEESLESAGVEIVSPTGTHLCLLKLPNEVDSLDVQKNLEAVGIITNRNAIPGDTKSAWRPSGLRLGTAALASRGLTVAQASEIGGWIAEIIQGKELDAGKVSDVAASLAWYY